MAVKNAGTIDELRALPPPDRPLVGSLMAKVSLKLSVTQAATHKTYWHANMVAVDRSEACGLH